MMGLSNRVPAKKHAIELGERVEAQRPHRPTHLPPNEAAYSSIEGWLVDHHWASY